MSEQRSAKEGDRGPSGYEDAQPGRYGAQVEQPGRGDIGAERGGQGDEEPTPGGRFRTTAPEPPPGSHQKQVDGDRVSPCLPSVLSGGRGQIVQVGEGQRGGDYRLDEHGVEADGQGTHGATPSDSRHGGGRDLARDGHASRGE